MIAAGIAAFAVLLVLLGCAAFVDIRRMIIPDAVNLGILATGLAASFALEFVEPASALIAALLGGGLFFVVQSGFRAYRGYEGLGTGDIKFIAAGATWTGVEGLAPTLLVSCLAALVFAGCRRLLDAGIRVDDRIPFGPFLAFGIAIAAAAPYVTGTSWFDLVDRLTP